MHTENQTNHCDVSFTFSDDREQFSIGQYCTMTFDCFAEDFSDSYYFSGKVVLRNEEFAVVKISSGNEELTLGYEASLDDVLDVFPDYVAPESKKTSMGYFIVHFSELGPEPVYVGAGFDADREDS